MRDECKREIKIQIGRKDLSIVSLKIEMNSMTMVDTNQKQKE